MITKKYQRQRISESKSENRRASKSEHGRDRVRVRVSARPAGCDVAFLHALLHFCGSDEKHFQKWEIEEKYPKGLMLSALLHRILRISRCLTKQTALNGTRDVLEFVKHGRSRR